MEISRDSMKILRYLRAHGETEIQNLCWNALGYKLLKKDPYFFEEIGKLEDDGLILSYREESQSKGDFLTMIRLTPAGKAFADANQSRTKEYWFNEIRAWITAAVAVASLVLSFIALRY